MSMLSSINWGGEVTSGNLQLIKRFCKLSPGYEVVHKKWVLIPHPTILLPQFLHRVVVLPYLSSPSWKLHPVAITKSYSAANSKDQKCRGTGRPNILATWWEKLTHWKSPWCWERLKAGEEDYRGWDGWMASPAWWTWVWTKFRELVMEKWSLACCSPWDHRVGQEWMIELNLTEWLQSHILLCNFEISWAIYLALVRHS